MTTSHPVYRPDLIQRGDGLEQRFTANVVAVDDDADVTLVAFGDLVPEPGRHAKHGTPVHSLILQLPPDDAFDEDLGGPTIEFNQQGNECNLGALRRVELGRTHFRLVFDPGCGPYAGRVPLAPEIELFEDSPDLDEVGLEGVCVLFSVDDTTHATLRQQLSRFANLCEVELIEAATP